MISRILPGILREGDNLLELESLRDAGASYSLVFLDRFELVHPRSLSAPGGIFEASFSLSGSAEVSGLEASSLLLDTTAPSAPRWLFDASPTPSGTTFRAEQGREYLALGRLPASSPEQAQALVEKILAFEGAGLTLREGPAVLVADNPDRAGDFGQSAR